MRLTALLPCGAVTLAACGGGGSPKRSDADRVRDTLSAFAQASAKHDYRRVCADLLAKPVIDSVRRAGLSCENAMKTALQGVEAPKLEVGQVTIKGNRASAKVHTTAANQQASDDTVALVKEGEGWKIGALGRGLASVRCRLRGARVTAASRGGERRRSSRLAAPRASPVPAAEFLSSSRAFRNTFPQRPEGVAAFCANACFAKIDHPLPALWEVLRMTRASRPKTHAPEDDDPRHEPPVAPSPSMRL